MSYPQAVGLWISYPHFIHRLSTDLSTGYLFKKNKKNGLIHRNSKHQYHHIYFYYLLVFAKKIGLGANRGKLKTRFSQNARFVGKYVFLPD